MRKITPVELSDFPMPSTFETECVVISDLIAAPEIIPVASAVLSPGMFNDENCRRAWTLLQERQQSGKAIDLTTIGPDLDQEFFQKKLLPKIISNTGTGARVEDHCRTLAMLHSRKIAYRAGFDLIRLSSLATEEELLAVVERMKAEISGSSPDGGTVDAITAVNVLFGGLERGDTKHIPSGLSVLDAITGGGFSPGELIILAARPSVGKTALALQMAKTTAKSGAFTTYFSLEMTNEELARRLLASTGSVTSAQIDSPDWPALEQAASDIPERLSFNDRLVSLDRIMAEMTLANRGGRLDIAFIDYLGLIAPLDPKALLVYDIANRTRKLKEVAKRLGIPIVILSQLNRNSATEGRPPQLYDLRDSGGIEQDADVVLMLEPVENENSDYPDLNLWVRKNRRGKRDIKIRLSVGNQYTTFRERYYE